MLARRNRRQARERGVGEAEQRAGLRTSQSREENGRRLRIIQAPGGAQHRAAIRAETVRQADSRSNLFVVVGDALRRLHQMAAMRTDRPYTNVHLLSGYARLRLRVPGLVETSPVSDRQAWRGLPLVLPVEPEPRLVVRGERIGFENILIIQAEALDELKRAIWRERQDV